MQLPRREFLIRLVPFLFLLAIIAGELSLLRPIPIPALFAVAMTVAFFVQNLSWRLRLFDLAVSVAIIAVLFAVCLPAVTPSGGRHPRRPVPQGEPPYQAENLALNVVVFTLFCLCLWAANHIEKRKNRSLIDPSRDNARKPLPKKTGCRDPFDDPI